MTLPHSLTEQFNQGRLIYFGLFFLHEPTLKILYV